MNHWARPLPKRTVTAGEVLDRLNAVRQRDVFSWDATDRLFLPVTPFREWIERVGWDEFCPVEDLHCALGVPMTDEDWANLWASEATTLGDVCTWVADHTEREYVEPLSIAGTQSYEAGLFLAILHVMERVGIDTRGIKPSDLLTPWLVDHWRKIMPELRMLFLFQLPESSYIQHPLTRAGNAMCLWEFLLLVISGMMALIADAVEVLLTSLASLTFGFTSRVIGEDLQPSHERFVDEMTFADLARHIAAAEGRSGDRPAQHATCSAAMYLPVT